MSIIANLWTKIPVIIRAVLNGFFVQIIGFILLVLIVPMNMKYASSLPWGILPLGVALWAYWTYFGGKGWPASTSEIRSQYRRANSVDPTKIKTIFITSLLFGLVLYGIAVLQYGLRPIPIEALGMVSTLAELPKLTAIPLAIMIAIFVGVGEEMSYRGYMQVPIEKRYGPLLGLTIPAFFFAISHGLDPERLIVFFLVSIGWGALAIVSNSIRPGIVLHAMIDGVTFIWVIFDIKSVNRLMAYSILEDGLTPGLKFLIVTVILLLILTILFFVKLWKKRSLNIY